MLQAPVSISACSKTSIKNIFVKNFQLKTSFARNSVYPFAFKKTKRNPTKLKVMNHSSHSFIKLLIHLFIHYSKLNQNKNQKISPQVWNSFLEKRSISSFDGVFDAACLSVWRCMCERECACARGIVRVSEGGCVWVRVGVRCEWAW